jgi:hypothetical protein
MKKIFIVIAMMLVVAVSASGQGLFSCNLGDTEKAVTQKLAGYGFTLEEKSDNIRVYLSDGLRESEDGLKVKRVNAIFRTGFLVFMSCESTYMLSSVMFAIDYAKFLKGNGSWDLEKLDLYDGEIRKWREFENELILGANPRWRDYSLYTVANSRKGLPHTELYFISKAREALIGIEWYNDDIILCWGTAEYFGAD